MYYSTDPVEEFLEKSFSFFPLSSSTEQYEIGSKEPSDLFCRQRTHFQQQMKPFFIIGCNYVD